MKTETYYIYIANIGALKDFSSGPKIFVVKNRSVEELKRRLARYKDKFVYLRNNVVKIEVKKGTDIKKLEEELNKTKDNRSTVQIIDSLSKINNENILSKKVIRDVLVLDYDLEDSYIDYEEVLDIVDKMIFLRGLVGKARIIVSKDEGRYKNMQIQFKYLNTTSEYEKIVVENKIKKNFFFDKALLDREQYYLFMYSRGYNRTYERKIKDKEKKKKILELEEEIRRKKDRLLTMLFYRLFKVEKENRKTKVGLKFSTNYKEYERKFEFMGKEYKNGLAVFLNKRFKEIKKKEGEYIYNKIVEKRIEYIRQMIKYFEILEKKYKNIFNYKDIYDSFLDIDGKKNKINNIMISKEDLLEIVENIKEIDLDDLYKYLVVNFKRNNIFYKEEMKRRINREEIIEEIKKVDFDYVIIFNNSVENILFKVTKNYAKIYNAIYKYIEENNIEHYKTIFTNNNIPEEYINNNLYIILWNIVKKGSVKYVNKENKEIVKYMIKEFKKEGLKTLKELEEEEKAFINSDKSNIFKLIKEIYKAKNKERKKIREENKEFIDSVIGIEKTKKHSLRRLATLEERKVIVRETVVSKGKEVEVVNTIIYNTYRKLAEKNGQKDIIEDKEEFIEEIGKKDFEGYFKFFVLENDVKLLVKRTGIAKYLKKVDYTNLVHFIKENESYSYLNKFIEGYFDVNEDREYKIKKAMFYILSSSMGRSLLKLIVKFLEDKGFLKKKERKENIERPNWEVDNVRRYLRENYYEGNRYNCLVKVTGYIEQRGLYNDKEVLAVYNEAVSDYEENHRSRFRFLNENW